MPAFGLGSAYNWNDQRISYVLTYIRAEWGNAASPITPEQLTAIRTAEPRTAAWTAEALKALQ
jgi:mono/diheme cytochrome c family protein